MNQPFSIGQAFIKLKKELALQYDSQEAIAMAHAYIEALTGWSKTERLIQKEQLLTQNQYLTLQKDLVRLLSCEPLQHIIGYQWFAGSKFLVNKHVLIPRPETEELVQWIIDEHCSSPQLSILDIGTGSGCIPISLKKKLSQANIMSFDVSKEALTVAVENAKTIGVSIDFKHLDFLNEANWKDIPSVDILVSNPPYIPLAEKDYLDRNVRDFEPPVALFVDDTDRFIFYRKLAFFGLDKLNKSGAIYCEIHRDFAQETTTVFAEAGYTNIELRKDIFGNDRMLKISR